MTEHGNPEAQKLVSYPLFDWLRFCLASVVVLDHAGFKFADFATGGLAVQVFFALSGWLIGGILLRTQAAELPRFYFNRATRIWIPYALAIVLLYGTALAKEGYSYFWLKYLIFDVTFTHQLFTVFPQAAAELPMDGSGNQFWSIAVEEQFYLIAPLVIIFAPFGRRAGLWIFFAAIAAALAPNATSIALGVAAAAGAQQWPLGSIVRIAAAAVALVCAAAIQLTAQMYFLVPLFAVAVVIALAWPGRRSALAVLAGGLSYPLYLNHWIGVFAVHFAGKHVVSISQAAFIVAQYVFNVLFALGLYWTVDCQVLQRRNAWFTTKVGLTFAGVAYALVAAGLSYGAIQSH